jgi:hypothetical protein
MVASAVRSAIELIVLVVIAFPFSSVGVDYDGWW